VNGAIGDFVVRFLRGRPELAGVRVRASGGWNGLGAMVIVRAGGQLTAEVYGPDRVSAGRLALVVRALLVQLDDTRHAGPNGVVEVTEVTEEFGPMLLQAPERYVLRLSITAEPWVHGVRQT
jgi:hypothetical protein